MQQSVSNSLTRAGITNFAVQQSITAVSYVSLTRVVGMHIGSLHEQCLSSARYMFSGVSEWFPKASSESWDDDYIVLKIPRKDREMIAAEVPESGLRVSVNVCSELLSTDTGGRTTNSVVYVEVKPMASESLNWYLKMGNRLENFFSLFTGASVAVESMFIYRDQENAHVNVGHDKHSTRFQRIDSILYTPAQLANSLVIWLSARHGFEFVEYLALGVARKTKLFIETEFLTLAQALEGFHRTTAKATVVEKAEFRRVRKRIIKLLEDEHVDANLAERICESLPHANELKFATRLTLFVIP
jgi:hypothetical protein